MNAAYNKHEEKSQRWYETQGNSAYSHPRDVNEEHHHAAYAIIPAMIFYNKDLTNAAKLVYGDISNLANQRGYCYASNTYFAKLRDMHKNSISRIISTLVKNEFIRIEIIYYEGTKNIKERRISLNFPTINNTVSTSLNLTIDTPKNNGLTTPPPINNTVKHPINLIVKENILIENILSKKESKEETNGTVSENQNQENCLLACLLA